MMKLRNGKSLTEAPERHRRNRGVSTQPPRRKCGEVSLTTLPVEIIVMIFSYLSTSCLLCRVARVCKLFNRLSKDCCFNLDVGSHFCYLPKPVLNFLCGPDLINLRSLYINDFVPIAELEKIAEARKDSLVKLTLSDSYTLWSSSDYERAWQTRNHCKVIDTLVLRPKNRDLGFLTELSKLNSLRLNFLSFDQQVPNCLPPNSLPAITEVTVARFENRYEAEPRNYNPELACVTLAKACPNLKSYKLATSDELVTSETLTSVVASCQLLEVLVWNASIFGQVFVAGDDAVDKICANLPNLKILDLEGWHLSEQGERAVLRRCQNLVAFCPGSGPPKQNLVAFCPGSRSSNQRIYIKTGKTLEDLDRLYGFSPNMRRFEVILRF